MPSKRPMHSGLARYLHLSSPFSPSSPPSSFFHASFLSSFLFFRSFQRRTKARWLVRKSAGHYASFVSFLFRAALLAPLHNHVEQRSHSSDQFTVENFWSRRFFPPWRKKQQGEKETDPAPLLRNDARRQRYYVINARDSSPRCAPIIEPDTRSHNAPLPDAAGTHTWNLLDLGFWEFLEIFVFYYWN